MNSLPIITFESNEKMDLVTKAPDAVEKSLKNDIYTNEITDYSVAEAKIKNNNIELDIESSGLGISKNVITQPTIPEPNSVLKEDIIKSENDLTNIVSEKLIQKQKRKKTFAFYNLISKRNRL